MIQMMCLITAIYFESGNQSLVGQVAVGDVIINRVLDPRYPSTICEVTKEGRYVPWSDHPVRNMCQFSFWCDGKPEEAPTSPKSLLAAALALYIPFDVSGGATHYHASYVAPSWARDSLRTVAIGQHIFYKNP